MQRYDLIIAGSGAAGLTLAYYLAHGPLHDLSILIVDRDTKDRNDRTWWYWSNRPTPFDGIVYRSWDSLRLAADGIQRTITLAPYRYQMIRDIDFYRFVRQDLSARPNVQFLKGTVQRIEDGPDGARVCVDGAEYLGRWVFDSLFDPSQLVPCVPGYHHLLQQFKGWEIEVSGSHFDQGAATFLDFRTPQDGAARFFYLLPISERRALVEYVACVSNPLLPGEADESFNDYLGSVLSVGVRGGRVKPSTGFAFTRIQQDSAAIVRSLARSGHPFDLPPDSRRYRLYDSLMLQIMSRHGERVKTIFAALFEKNPIQRVLRFLDEDGSLWENLLLIASLPDPIFLRALFRLKVLRRTWWAGMFLRYWLRVGQFDRTDRSDLIGPPALLESRHQDQFGRVLLLCQRDYNSCHSERRAKNLLEPSQPTRRCFDRLSMTVSIACFSGVLSQVSPREGSDATSAVAPSSKLSIRSFIPTPE